MQKHAKAHFVILADPLAEGTREPTRPRPRRGERPAKAPDRLEMIARRQHNSRRRDLLFACFVALAAISGVSAAGARALGAATHTTQR